MLGVKFGKSPAGRMVAPEVLSPLTAMGDTLRKEVLVPAQLTGDQFALAVQILLLTDWKAIFKTKIISHHYSSTCRYLVLPVIMRKKCSSFKLVPHQC